MGYPKLVENLIEQLCQLPGVGRRSAERMVFWFLNRTRDEAADFTGAVTALKDKLRLCRVCQHLSEEELCQICQDPNRDQAQICVVEEHKHLLAIERTGAYRGLYHVLLGAIAPSEGRGPEDLPVQGLLERVQGGKVREVILATDPDTEGEMTAIYLTKLLRPSGVKVSRIGLGIPVGSSVEYADLSTLSVSMTSRREIEDSAK